MSAVNLHNISKSYGDAVVVEPTNLEIKEGELLALLGPSGCGKTTTLRMIAGFITPSEGSIHIGSRNVTSIPVHQRNVGMVFQGYALFPHLTVAENIAFGLKLSGWNKQKIKERVDRMLSWVRLEKYADRYPKALSGGQQQRVAIARAMAYKPEVLLLDEPFSALDAKLRTQMRSEIRDLQKDANITSVFVTHDQEEAMAIADRIGVMNQGKLEQIGSAEDLYRRPSSRFVASFIGKCNFIEGRVSGSDHFESIDGHQIRFNSQSTVQHATALCFRPENATLTDDPEESCNSLPVTLKSASYLGPYIEFEVVTNAGNTLYACAHSVKSNLAVEPGRSMYLNWSPDDSMALG